MLERTEINFIAAVPVILVRNIVNLSVQDNIVDAVKCVWEKFLALNVKGT
jgi:hypothetical protein